MEREAWALGQVQHPAVPRLIAAGHDDGGAYVLETFFDAPSLRMLSAEVRAGTRGLTSVLFRRLLYAAFGALAEIHAFEIDGQSLRLVHGDLAPDHVLIGDGRIHFIDFGQARATTWPAALAGRGTLPYVPPEVARGEQEPGQSADVFALAACFAFLALGRDPIRADLPAARLVEVGDRGLDLAQLDLAQLGKAAFGQPSLDESCIVALRRALAFHRADRIQSASDMLRGLT